jgi:hypothetical protein
MTKCEIIVREKRTDRGKPGITVARPDIYVVELFKAFDGDPSSMEKYLLSFVEWLQEDERSLSIMRDANLMGALLIVFDWEWTKKFFDEHPEADRQNYPDTRPRGDIEDADFLYLIDLPQKDDVAEGLVQLRVRSWGLEKKHDNMWTSFIHKGKAPPKGFLNREKILTLDKVEERIAKARKIQRAIPETVVTTGIDDSTPSEYADEPEQTS